MSKFGKNIVSLRDMHVSIETGYIELRSENESPLLYWIKMQNVSVEFIGSWTSELAMKTQIHCVNISV